MEKQNVPAIVNGTSTYWYFILVTSVQQDLKLLIVTQFIEPEAAKEIDSLLVSPQRSQQSSMQESFTISQGGTLRLKKFKRKG